MGNGGLRVITLAAVFMTITGLSAGCGGEKLAEQIGEQIVNGDVDIQDDSVSITDDEGNEFAAGSGTELPASWPKDVPLFPDEQLVLATSQSDSTATALWETSSTVDVAVSDYDTVLLAHGFTLDQDANIGGTVVRSYSGKLHRVNVTVAQMNGTTSVSITVVPS